MAETKLCPHCNGYGSYYTPTPKGEVYVDTPCHVCNTKGYLHKDGILKAYPNTRAQKNAMARAINRIRVSRGKRNKV